MSLEANRGETQYAQVAAYGLAHWASLEPEAVMAELGASPAGLNKAEVAERLACYGHNTLPRLRRRPWYLELAANFIYLFALLLWAGAGLAWVAGMPQLAWAIIAVILINGLFSFWQEYQAERAAEALEALLPRQVTVKREGQAQLVPTSEIAPGDLLLLSEGEATPADARLISAAGVRLDVSSLTGESRPIPRTAERISAAPDAGAVTLSNLVFAGTTMASGCGEAVVFATGANTEFGRIAQLTQSQDERLSPLQRELKRVTRVVTILAVGLGMVFFVIGVKLGGLSPTSGFLFAIGIIVANVPEGLLPTLTLALALGVKRMARRRALVKRLSSVETLGATTVILTDKTGTLTENEMTARELWAGGAIYQLSGTGYEPFGELAHRDGAENAPAAVTEMLRAAALCCDARLVSPQNDQRRWTAIGDPTEAAILAAAAKLGLPQDNLAAWPRLAELPFDSKRKRMTTIQRIDGDSVACTKGAPGEIFARCVAIRLRDFVAPFDDEWRRRAEAAHDAMARRGLRVLAVATSSVDPNSQSNDGWRVENVERELTLLGMIAMEDPPPPEVPSAIAACRQAGVRVVMVTGDNGLTAAAIASEIGLSDCSARVVTGVELDSLDNERLAALLDTTDVIFARVAPEHKLRLVEAYQRKGEVVAVTGDGVNDAPALKRADIGVAMGITGTDVAREAADMVLADDNFASIVAAIEEGRAVYDNVRKFVTYIFAHLMPEAIPFIAFVLFHIPLPLTVMQILAVDLGTDLLPALALGAESPEQDVMRRPPRSRRERLLNLPTFAPGLSHEFGEKASAHLGVPLSAHEEREFEDSEHKIRPLVNVRGKDVFVIQSLYGDNRQSVNDKLCRLLFFLGALRDASAERVTAVVPYLCYARKDKKSKPRDPVTTRYVAGLFEAMGVNRVVTLDAHNLAAFQNAFRIRTDHLEAKRLFVEYFIPLARQEEIVVVSPDVGGVKRAEDFRQALGHALDRPIHGAFMEKYRSEGVVSGEAVIGDVSGKMAIIIDDLISSGTTLARAAVNCRSRGATKIYAAASHGVFTGKASQTLSNPALEKVVITDTIPPFRLDPDFARTKLVVLDAARLFAEAIRRIHSGGSIVELLET